MRTAMSSLRRVSHEQLAKGGFLLGLTLVALGAAGEAAAHAGILQVSSLIQTLFFDMEVFGVVLFVVSPIVFAIVLPLVSGN